MNTYDLKDINNLQFEDLTPYNNLNDVDKDLFYTNIIKWAIERENIKNIALTGVYGSGKSSIIRKFVNFYNSEYKILDISLANFENSKVNDNQNLQTTSDQLPVDLSNKTKEPEKVKESTSASTLQELIERSIVQQMFYKEKSQNLSLSRFKRIVYEHSFKISLKAFFLACWIIASLLLLIPSLYQKIVFILIDKIDINKNIIFLFGIIFFTGSIVILFNFIKKFQNIKLNKFGFGGAQVEISESKDISILNKHLDEILYFFEVLDYHLVIIEDLDRFNNTEIFVKLRELNMLINNYVPIRQKKKVVFIYAIKDELFKDKDRSKFFDFIIPIIPVVNSSNSGDHMITKYAKLIHADDQMKELMLDISLFIDDMRLIKNIFNEYKIYHIKLGTEDKFVDAKKSNKISPNMRYKRGDTKSEYAKLFAMIVYKNLLPDDFSNLNYNSGILYELFSVKKEELIKTISMSYQEKIDELEKEINKIDQESLIDISELRKLFLYQIFKNSQLQIQNLYVDNTLYDLDSIANDSVIFSKILGSTQILSQNHNGINVSRSAVENIYGQYEQRSKVILDKQAKKQEIMYSQMTELKNTIIKIKKYSLAHLLQNYENELIIIDKNNKDLQFLSYLIYNGYIDENYYDFTSFFYEGSLTKDEREYLKDIKSGTAPDYNHKIINIKTFVERLHFSNYEKHSVLNYQILDYLLLDNKNIEIKNAFFKLLNDSTFDFIDSYFMRNAYLGDQSPTLQLEHRFINELCQRWNGFWEHVKYSSSLDEDYYMALVLCHANMEDIEKFQMVSDILEKENFLSIFNNERVKTRDSISKIKQVIESLNLKFKTLKIENVYETEKLFKFIYENSYYEISIDMIDQIIKYFDPKSYSKLKPSHYTTLKTSSCKEVLEYIQSNLETYISNVFLALETNTEESLDTIQELLKSNLSLETKQNIIKKQNIQFTLLSEVKPELWSILFEKSKILPTWDNVALYIKEHEYAIDTAMSIFLNQDNNYSKLSEYMIDTSITIDDIDYSDIEKSFIKCTLLNEESYISIICSSFISIIPLEEVADHSGHIIDCLLKKQLISLSPQNYLSLKEKFSPLHIFSIIINFELFLKQHNDYSLELNDYELLLKEKNLPIEGKLSLITIIDFTQISNKDYNLVSLIINILNEARIIQLSDTQILILIKFSKSLKEKLLLLSKYIPVSFSIIEEILNILGGNYVNITKLARTSSPKFTNDILHQNFMNNLFFKSYIESWKVEKNQICIVRKRH